MATYKVPQDVEADDKLIGPFSFRQFVYLIIAAIAIALAWALSQLFIPLAIIPLPIIIFFGALALPLRKDQPMEIYLAAVVSFYLKPRKRFWQPDGIQSLVEITAPKVVEIQRAKNLSEMEAQQRLSYLADIVDTEGWAVRGVGIPLPNSPMTNDAYYAAQQTEDVLDKSSVVARSFDSMIDQADTRHYQELVKRMQAGGVEPVTPPPRPQPILSTPDPYASLTPPTSASETVIPPSEPTPHLTFNPYPTIHQSVINPLDSQSVIQPAQRPEALGNPHISPSTTSEKVVSPDIINLANNSDLSIETIAHEAKRIHQKEEGLPDDEVIISLR